MLFFRQRPPIRKMSEAQYRRYRLVLAVLLFVWATAAVGIIGYWSQLPFLLKCLAVVVSFVVAPDIAMFIQLFSSYKRYAREGLE
jgi:hypothetical protein